jgi:hypothetical protein
VCVLYLPVVKFAALALARRFRRADSVDRFRQFCQDMGLSPKVGRIRRLELPVRTERDMEQVVPDLIALLRPTMSASRDTLEQYQGKLAAETERLRKIKLLQVQLGGKRLGSGRSRRVVPRKAVPSPDADASIEIQIRQFLHIVPAP